MRRFTLLSAILSTSLCLPTWAASPPSSKTPTPPNFPSSNTNNADISKPNKTRARIAIIIDDLGYSLEAGKKIVELPGAVTVSILPHSPHGVALAELAASRGKEVMLHTPMSAVDEGRTLDPGGLTASMSREQLLATLKANLAAIPHVKGLNNHMGSQLTQFQQPMTWVMQELRARELYFVDSRTIANSLAWQTAVNQRVATTQRDVFLDNDPSLLSIAKQFNALLAIAQKHGQAVAIGHPYPETIQFLEIALPLLAPSNITVVSVSELVIQPTPPQWVLHSGYLLDDPPFDVSSPMNDLAP